MKILKAGFIAAICITATACSDSDGAMRVLSQQGYTDITTHGHSLFGCSEDDFYRTEFEATAINGDRVTGVVCSGWGPFGKGSTVRVF